jgi:hypothetical protein
MKGLSRQESPLSLLGLFDQILTYPDLVIKGTYLARFLEKKGIGPGDIFSIVMRNHPELLYAMFAASALDAVLVPVDPRSEAEKLIFQIQDSQDLMFEPGPHRIQDRFLLIYTSGSTGNPKGIWTSVEKRFDVIIHEWYDSMEGGFCHNPPGIGSVGSFGKPLSMEMMPVPHPGPGQVLIKIGIAIGIGIEMALGHEKLDVYRIAAMLTTYLKITI